MKYYKKFVKLIVFWMSLSLVIWITVEGMAFIGLKILEKYKGIYYRPVDLFLSDRHKNIIQKMVQGKQLLYRELDPDLGWTTRPNTTTSNYTINKDGIRASREYSKAVPPDKIRIAAFGNSFTFGSYMKNDQTWEYFIETLDSRLEVLNFGVGTYGVDQAYLRYKRDGMRFNPQFVLIGFLPENINRHVNVYRPFYSRRGGMPLSKPRFFLKNNQLVLHENLLKTYQDYEFLMNHETKILSKLGKFDHFFNKSYRKSSWDILPSVCLYKISKNILFLNQSRNLISQQGYYDPASEAYQITRHLFDAFYSDVKRAGSKPILLIFVRQADIQHYCRYGEKGYAAFLKYFEKQGYDYIDLMDVFDRCNDVKQLQPLFTSSHYSEHGNRIAAEYIYERMMSQIYDESP